MVLVGTAAAQRAFEITPSVQGEIDRQKAAIAQWAAHPDVLRAVKEQNTKGPLTGMDNAKWKTLRRSELVVRTLQMNPAARFLKAKVDESGGVYGEAFLNAAQGEKVAFVEKTTSYIHKGQAKFDVPFQTGQSWQGKAELDESSQMYNIQVSVPVLDAGKPIGALVVGLNLTHLERTAKR
jgi:hypothetical protein